MPLTRRLAAVATVIIVGSLALSLTPANAGKKQKKETFALYPGVDAKKLKRSLIVPGHTREIRASGIVRNINYGQRWVVIKSKKHGTWKVYISSNADLRYSGTRLPFGLLRGGAYISVIGRQAGPNVIAARHIIAHSGIMRIGW